MESKHGTRITFIKNGEDWKVFYSFILSLLRADVAFKISPIEITHSETMDDPGYFWRYDPDGPW